MVATCIVACAEEPGEAPDNNRIRCAEQQGTCTPALEILCSPGLQPFTSNDPEYTDCVGQCCVEPAVVGSCNPKGTDTDGGGIATYNCVPDGDDGRQCPGVWDLVTGNLTCEEGRSCCFLFL